MNRHNWNNLENYLDVHDSVFRQYMNHFSNLSSTDFILESSDRIWLNLKDLELTTFSSTIVLIDIEKRAAINCLNGTEIAKTISYRYHSRLSGGGNLIRYCSPHQHRPYHHKHDYTSGINNVTQVGNDDWPHISEFLDELLNRF